MGSSLCPLSTSTARRTLFALPAAITESEKEFTYETDDEYLGELLTEEGLVEGETSEYGMYITKVDGEQAVFETDNAYWALYENGEYASTGADQTVLDNGDEFSLVYTKDAS